MAFGRKASRSHARSTLQYLPVNDINAIEGDIIVTTRKSFKTWGAWSLGVTVKPSTLRIDTICAGSLLRGARLIDMLPVSVCS